MGQLTAKHYALPLLLVFLVSCHCLSLWLFTPSWFDYLYGHSLIVLGSSFFLIDRKSLYLYLGSSFVLAILGLVSLEGEISEPFWLLSLLLFTLLVGIGSVFRIRIKEACDEAEGNLEKSYKLNLKAAHDLEAPILTISGVAEKIKYENPKLIKLLEASVEQIKEVSQELIVAHFTKDLNVESDFFDLENSISQIIKDKRQEFKDVSHFFIMYRVTAPVIGQVKLPKTEFYRVLSNIINNGIEAMNGQLEKRMKIVIDPRAEEVSILITDNGPGIEEDKVDLIFQENVSFKKGGTGIGLSFAKKKVEEWGGEIHLKSTNSSGTTFELIVPYA